MTSVASADDSSTASTIAMRPLLSVSPVVVGVSTRRSTGRPTKIISSTKAIDSATIVSSVATAPPAVVIATTKARMLHAVTSSTAAQVMADASERRVRQAALVQDARQHRKGRDAHRDPAEQRERIERHAGRGVLRVERERQRHAEHEGDDDAEVADRNRRLRPARAGVTASSSSADDEHEQQHADLTEQLQDRHRRGGKQERARGRRDPAEQRRTEQHAGGDLADDRRLSHACSPARPARVRRVR